MFGRKQSVNSNDTVSEGDTEEEIDELYQRNESDSDSVEDPTSPAANNLRLSGKMLHRPRL